MARPTLYTQNTKELVQRAQANKRNDEYVSFTGLAVPHRKADREAYLAAEDNDARKAIRQTFGIPYPLIDAAQQIVDNDARTLVRVAKVFAELGEGKRWTYPATNGILAKVERGTVDVEGFIDDVQAKAFS